MENVDSQSLLVVCAFIFAIALYIWSIVKGPRLGIVNKGVHFDKAKMPSYFKFIAVVVVSSVLFGYILTRNPSLALGFAGLNLLIGSILGLQLFLFRRTGDNKKS